jgi:hypothetical protein
MRASVADQGVDAASACRRQRAKPIVASSSRIRTIELPMSNTAITMDPRGAADRMIVVCATGSTTTSCDGKNSTASGISKHSASADVHNA